MEKSKHKRCLNKNEKVMKFTYKALNWKKVERYKYFRSILILQ